MMNGMDMMMWPGVLFAVLLIALVVAAGVAAVKWLRGESFRAGSGKLDQARLILEKRYAASEIDKDEYERIRKDIE